MRRTGPSAVHRRQLRRALLRGRGRCPAGIEDARELRPGAAGFACGGHCLDGERGSAERKALWWYRLRGWKILGTNAWAAGYELDLIVRRGRVVRFVEVKEKRGTRFGDPLEMVTPEKQRRLRQAAETWLASRSELGALSIGFDVIAVRNGRVQRVPQAF